MKNSMNIVRRLIKPVDINKEIVKSIISRYKISKQVILSSGKRSDYYWDIKSLLLDNTDWNQIKNILIKDLKSKFPGMTCVAGFGIGGITFAMRIASCSDFNINPLIIRENIKEHGLVKQVEGYCPNGTPRVVIVDDVCTTGKSFRVAEKILRDTGIKTLGNYVLLKRKESKFNCESLVTA